jgi:hypothetical protein
MGDQQTMDLRDFPRPSRDTRALTKSRHPKFYRNSANMGRITDTVRQRIDSHCRNNLVHPKLLGASARNRVAIARQRYAHESAAALACGVDIPAFAGITIGTLIERRWISAFSGMTGNAPDLLQFPLTSEGGVRKAHAVCLSEESRCATSC